MRNYPRLFPLLILPLLLLGCATKPLVPSHFAGSWDTPAGSADLSLDLTQTGSHLAGYHAAVALHSNRLDAVQPNDGSPSITGLITGNIARVHFQSGYRDDAHGEALLTLHPDGTLTWKITQSQGAHYLPATATLVRSKPTPPKT